MVTKAFVGIGAWQEGLSTVADALSEQERRKMYDLGVRSEVSGVQLDGGHETFGRMWREGGQLRADRTQRWIASHGEQMRAVLGVQ